LKNDFPSSGAAEKPNFYSITMTPFGVQLLGQTVIFAQLHSSLAKQSI
jgi:hypothetical protein